MKTLKYYLISFLSIITLFGFYYLGFFDDMIRIFQPVNFMNEIDKWRQYPCFMIAVRYFITLFGAVAVQIFALFKNFNGSIRFLKQFFPNRSITFYNRANFYICVIIGSIIGFIFFNPQSSIGALAAGFSWQGAITVMMTREKNAPDKEQS
jgi:hypothetical protein